MGRYPGQTPAERPRLRRPKTVSGESVRRIGRIQDVACGVRATKGCQAWSGNDTDHEGRTMRLPRVRFTVRRMMVLVLATAVDIAFVRLVATEWGDREVLILLACL